MYVLRDLAVPVVRRDRLRALISLTGWAGAEGWPRTGKPADVAPAAEHFQPARGKGKGHPQPKR